MEVAASDHYQIRPDYRINESVSSHDDVSGKEYWDEGKIRASFDYQYYVYRWAAQLASNGAVEVVLDIGCGPASKLALVAEAAPYARIYGIDQPNAVAYCRDNRPFGEWIEMDIERGEAPALNQLPDLIICCDVIEHVENPDRVIELLRQYSKPTTKLIISTPDRDRIRGREAVDCPHSWHVREWSAIEFRRYLRSRGLTIFETRWQWPVRVGLTSVMATEVIGIVKHRRHPKWNFVTLSRFAG